MDTPRKRKRREKLVKKFAEDWTVELKTGPTLKYNQKTGLVGIWQRFFGRKHSVFAMYWFFKNLYLTNEDARKFYFPLKHDNLPVKGVPFKYELLGTWVIEDEDLKYLHSGPLINSDLEVLVPTDTGVSKAIRIMKFLTPILVFVSALILLAVRIFQLNEYLPL